MTYQTYIVDRMMNDRGKFVVSAMSGAAAIRYVQDRVGGEKTEFTVMRVSPGTVVRL